jgi:predicted negative regulator of RcsB-dependent stress response
MSKTKISRKELLKKDDEFISITSHAINFVKGHKRLFDYLGTAVLCLIVIYMGVYAYNRHINKKGQEAFNKAFYTMNNTSNSDKAQSSSDNAEKMFNDLVKDYGMSKAATLALPELANAKFNQKKYDEAISLYEKYLDKVSNNESYNALARMALSTCYEQKGEYDKAVTSLEKILEGPDDNIKEQAMLNLARVYRQAGKQDKSNEVLTDFKKKFPKSVYLDMADSFLNS